MANLSRGSRSTDDEDEDEDGDEGLDGSERAMLPTAFVPRTCSVGGVLGSGTAGGFAIARVNAAHLFPSGGDVSTSVRRGTDTCVEPGSRG
jgi:hypothetical protein